MNEAFMLDPWQRENLHGLLMAAISDANMPCILYKPKLFLDGNMYCFLLGDDPMNGVAGFGETAQQAAEDFNRNFCNQKAPKPFIKVDAQEGK